MRITGKNEKKPKPNPNPNPKPKTNKYFKRFITCEKNSYFGADAKKKSLCINSLTEALSFKTYSRDCGFGKCRLQIPVVLMN